jgi:hypothetical protein
MKCPKYVKDAKGVGRVLGWRKSAFGSPGYHLRVIWADFPIEVEYEEWPGELVEISQKEYDITKNEWSKKCQAEKKSIKP